MVHLTNTFKEDHLWTFLQAFSWNVFSAEKALEAFENSSLLQHKQIVTTENRTGGHIATDRFAWIDPGALLEHVAPGQTMAALAEAANAALEAKLNATVV